GMRDMALLRPKLREWTNRSLLAWQWTGRSLQERFETVRAQHNGLYCHRRQDTLYLELACEHRRSTVVGVEQGIGQVGWCVIRKRTEEDLLGIDDHNPIPQGEAKRTPGRHQGSNYRKEQIILDCVTQTPAYLLSEVAQLS